MVGLRLHHVVDLVFFFIVLVSGAYSYADLDVVLHVEGEKVEYDLLVSLKFKHEVSGLFGMDRLVVGHTWLQPHVGLLGRGYQ